MRSPPLPDIELPEYEKMREKLFLSEWEVYEKELEQAQLGVTHSRIQVELGFILQGGTCQILNFATNTRQSNNVQGTELNWGEHRTEKVYTRRWGHRTYFLNRVSTKGGGGTPHIKTGSH